MNVPNTTNISSDPTYPVLSNTLPNQLLMQNPLMDSELVIGKYPVNQVNQLYPLNTVTTTSPLINPLTLPPMYNQVSLINSLTPTVSPVNSMIASSLPMEIPVNIPISPVNSMTSPLLNPIENPLSIPISPVNSMTSPLQNPIENPIENSLSPLMIDCGNDQNANLDFLNINSLLLQNSVIPSTDNNNSICQL